ncbi:MAG: ABC transporter permease subunit [Gammaproteobacteria bacterium]|nr:ABC transporter permease subunit [Gammaproteobacteria bacterium]
MAVPYHVGQTLPLSLDPHYLPRYALFTFLRMSVALLFSLLFTFVFATWAAKSRRAEQIIIPCIDIFQSLPVIAILSITIVGFIKLFPGSLLGPECAAVFAIFTSQVWNMALSFYQSLCTVPKELKEAAKMFHLSAWQRFWRIEVPFATPGLLWNMMMSMSASWFFLTVSESVTVADQTITLPGLGSYIALAIKHADLHAVGYVILAMLVVILIYDQLLFRPLIHWAEKFRVESESSGETSFSLFNFILHKTRLMQYVGLLWEKTSDLFVNVRFLRQSPESSARAIKKKRESFLSQCLWKIFVGLLLAGSLGVLAWFIFTTLSLSIFFHAVVLGAITGLRVLTVLIVSSLIWVPVGVWIGLRPRVAEKAQPIVQLLASFPANLLFPIVVSLIVRFHLNVEIWVTPLMILGTQWYILFNVIAGASAIPKDLKQAVDNFGLKGWLWWRKLILPAIFPYYVTGAITAAGGAWNTSIVAEVASWGDTTLRATGLGAYITKYAQQGNFPFIVLGMSVMCFYVLILNRFVWRRLYLLAMRRYSLTL